MGERELTETEADLTAALNPEFTSFGPGYSCPSDHGELTPIAIPVHRLELCQEDRERLDTLRAVMERIASTFVAPKGDS